MRKATAAKIVTDAVVGEFKELNGLWPLTAKIDPPRISFTLHGHKGTIGFEATKSMLEIVAARSRLSLATFMSCSLRGQAEVCAQFNSTLATIQWSIRPFHLLQEITPLVASDTGLDTVIVDFGLYCGRRRTPLLILESWPLSCFLPPEALQRAWAKAPHKQQPRLTIHRPLREAA